MKSITVFVMMVALQSCFLFSDFRKTKLSLGSHTVKTIVPKKFSRSPVQTDSAGNLVQYFHYGNGSALYFAVMKDTATQLQQINYRDNIPKELYHTIFYKQLDSTNHFSRETRFGNYRAGYIRVDGDDEGNFDSAINYFSLHMKR